MDLNLDSQLLTVDKNVSLPCLSFFILRSLYKVYKEVHKQNKQLQIF